MEPKPREMTGNAASSGAAQAKQNPHKPLLDGGPKSAPVSKVQRLLQDATDFDSNRRFREHAFNEIISAGQNPKTREEVVSGLRKALKDENQATAQKAAIALGHLKAKEAVGELAGATGETDTTRLWVRRNCITALGMLGEDAAAAGPALLQALYDPLTQRQALDALAGMGKAGASVFDEALSRKNNLGMKIMLIRSLGSMEHDAEIALPKLRRMSSLLHEWNGEVRCAAKEAIAKIKNTADAEKTATA
jgi:hypothetical protein